MIHAKSIERIFYNAGNGYTVAAYQTEEELPKKIVRSHPVSYTHLDVYKRQCIYSSNY